MMANRTKWTPKKKEKYLALLSDGSSVTKAAAAVAVSRSSAYSKKENDKEFSESWDSAVESGTDAMEDEAFRRAVEGVQEPIGFCEGIHQGTFVKKYSDVLLIFMLKARRPEKFKDRAEVAHKGGLSIHQFLDEISDTDGKN